MRIKSIFPAFFLAVFFLVACTAKEREASTTAEKSPGSTETIVPQETGTKINVAHAILYDVEIINPSQEDMWMTDALAGLNHEELVDFVFEGLNTGRFLAYDIFEGTPVSSKEIKRMEEAGEFSRDQIGLFQFVEEWFLDQDEMTFTKKVTEIRMGLQQKNPERYLTGYAPLLRVVL